MFRQFLAGTKAKSVMLPAAVRASTRLAIPCAVGVTKDSSEKSSAGANVLAMGYASLLRPG